MNSRQINSMLWTGSAIAVMAGVGGLLFAFIGALERQSMTDAGAGSHAASRAPATALPPLTAFEKIWNTPLRQALGDPIPIAPAPAQPVAATPVVPPVSADPGGVPVSLIGTIGQSIALLKTVTNAVEVCAVGDSFNGVTVIAIRPAEADVKFNGQVIKLSTPAEK